MNHLSETTNYILVKHYEKAPNIKGRARGAGRTSLIKEYSEMVARRVQHIIRHEWRKEHNGQFILVVYNGTTKRGKIMYDIHLHQLSLNRKQETENLTKITDAAFKDINEKLNIV